ncbi:PREDICTED: uncharacterized protein LOC109592891 [Amphimedon queenslandica]|uniref:Lysine-specific metallo-endopeptidase domain-containing protein n=1 Tax=Amphimedon queenslandica TaxID=400682 RepID=A0AAN0K397_AMPQE|nr:PREDICTED: uncharacterized protein LOC109592891 [Amphimedon queenslandica]|eukprot:XP_019863769.1 PREDICTED: uncharacterized protein LOC109592891 [Amphimedon queenslandica]
MKTLLFLFCLVIYLAFAISAANKQPISLQMDCSKQSSTVACSFVFTNNGKEDLYLLKRDTPIEGLFSPFIDVSLHGSEPIPYQGIIAYRLPPTKDDFVLLKVGESVSATVAITNVFNIDTDGLYNIRYSKPLEYLTVDDMILESVDELKELTVHESVYVSLEDTQLLVKPKEPEEPKLGHTVHIQDCATANFVVETNEHIADTMNVHKRLCSKIDVAKSKVRNGGAYSIWFGAYSPDRATKVTETLDRIKTGLTDHTITYEDAYDSWPCATYKAVTWTFRSYPVKPYTTVYLCRNYYRNPTYCYYSTYTKERFIMNVWAQALGYTDYAADYYSSCRKLAQNDPDTAVTNSYNYGFFYCYAIR